MKLKLFQVDAFAREVFRGNPAAVCPLDRWLPTETMQAIAQENALSETAFFVREGEGFGLSWFTPNQEVDLCGHATLASAHVLFHELAHPGDEIVFQSQAGRLAVRRQGERLTLDFPVREVEAVDGQPELVRALGRPPESIWATGRDYFVVYPSQSDVAALAPDLERLRWLDREGVIVTAQGKDADFVSRYFAPLVGIPEDPVTGSAHCSLTPFWARKLGKQAMFARQISPRGGELWVTLAQDRVLISGHVVRYLEGTIDVP